MIAQRARRVFIFVLVCVLAGTVSSFSQTTERRLDVAPGIEYIHEQHPDVPWSIHILKVQLSRKDYRLVTTLATGSISGVKTVRRQVESLPAELGKPVAAVNGDFFLLRPGPYQGDVLGLQIIRGELVSAPSGGTFWINPDGKPHIEDIRPKFLITWPDGTQTPFGLNEERKDDAVVLFTPTFGPSTRTKGGLSLVLEPREKSPWLPLRAGRGYEVRVSNVIQSDDIKLEADVMVLSVGPKLSPKMPALQEGATFHLSTMMTKDLSRVETAMGGGVILFAKGQKPKWDKNGKRHPRTVVGLNKNHLFLVVVDGRQKKLSMGMNYHELAELMSRLGCTVALNLDGGGSSTFWLEGKVMNSPSDRIERTVANAIVLLKKPQKEDLKSKEPE